MGLRIVKILASSEHKEFIYQQADHLQALQIWNAGTGETKQKNYNILIAEEHVQELTDKLQARLNKEKDWHIVIMPVDTVIPRVEESQQEEKINQNARKLFSGSITREALYDKIMAGAEINSDFIALVILSTLLACIGVITNNLAVIIAAMVIAPLLGPNLALSFGVTLGDKGMIVQSLKTNALGVSLTLLISMLAGALLPNQLYVENIEFLTRTVVGFDAIVLALISGVAAVLSLTSGISGSMVGVMVAVAMMPPAVVLGLSLGSGLMTESFGAALLLAVNVICVNLMAEIVFFLKGVRPRTWYRRKKSIQSLKLSLVVWMLLLALLCALIFIWRGYNIL